MIDTLIFKTPLEVEFDKVIWLFSSDHDQNCCEHHYLDFEWKKEEFETAKQFLTKVDKIEISWVEWMGVTFRMFDWDKEFPFFVAWRGSNNGYYGSNIDLIFAGVDGIASKTWSVTKYQDYN